jgi:hypothetical protein
MERKDLGPKSGIKSSPLQTEEAEKSPVMLEVRY